MTTLSQLSFSLIAAGTGPASHYSLETNLPILAERFGVEEGGNLLMRFQERVADLLARPEVSSYLHPEQAKDLASFLDLHSRGDEHFLEEGLIQALSVLHGLHEHYKALGVSPSEPTIDASRRRLPAHLWGQGPVGLDNSVFTSLEALRPSGSSAQAPSFVMSGAGQRSDGSTSKRVETAQFASPANRSSLPPLEQRRESRECVARWAQSKGGRPGLAIQRVLIINNGMSATRLIKGLRSLSNRIAIDLGLNPSEHRLIDIVGMASKSDLESGAKYLGEVDKLVKLPVEKAGDVFLNYDQILRVAREEGVDTLVLGWGFVAEKADFVKMAKDRGFNVVAPPHAAMSQLGGKISSKVLAEDADVPVFPWTRGAIETAYEAVRFARQQEYRLAIKADAGGGGKGIRLISGVQDGSVDYSTWSEGIGLTSEMRYQQMADVLASMPFASEQVPSADTFAGMSADDQSLWIQIIRIANILRRRREWLSKEQDEGVPESLTIIEEARVLMNGTTPEVLNKVVEKYILENHVASSFQSAADEGKMAFNDPTVFCEALAPEDARHIEIQVDADLDSEARALLERDCSGQIRRQKMFEEGPAIFVPDEIRRAMRSAAVRVAKKAGYTNLGTCEFLYSPSMKQFWFMEMNTRLQVEHPVTEGLLNIDLVELQMMRAMGVPVTAADRAEVDERFHLGRHVVAARINARDPNNGFAASPGKITTLRLPEIPNVRAYFSLREGSQVSTSSDSQIGHIFAWGATRERAIATLRQALEDTVVEGDGIKTTIEFSIDALNSDDFQKGKTININWLDKVAADYAERDLPVSGPVALTAAAIHRFEVQDAQSKAQFLSDLAGGRPLNRDLLVNVRAFELPFAGQNYQVTVRKLSNQLYALTLDGVTTEVEVVRLGKDYVLTMGGRAHEVSVSGTDELKVQVDGRNFVASTNDPTKIKSFTQGSAWKVLARKGQRVKQGDSLIVLESMKMEMPVKAEIAGTIKEIHIKEGEAVKGDQLLVEIEPEGAGESSRKKKETIRLDVDPHSILYTPERLVDHIDKFSIDTLQDVLLRMMQGAIYGPVGGGDGKSKKGKAKELTVEEIILRRYHAEAEQLRRDLAVNPSDKEVADRMEAMLGRLKTLIDHFACHEYQFARSGNDRAVYKAAGDGAFEVAMSHQRVETKTRVVLSVLDILRGLPYDKLVTSLRPLSESRAEAYREVRNAALDLMEYAGPRSEQDHNHTEERIIEAASLPPFSPQREALTAELIRTPLVSATTLLGLVEHNDYEVRCLAGYILLARSYAQHRLKEHSFRLNHTDRLPDEYSSWQYFDGVTDAHRLGIALRVSPKHGTLVQVLEKAAERLATERAALPPERDVRNDTVEILVSPDGHGDYESREAFLEAAREVLTRVMGGNPPKRVMISVRHGDGRPSDYHTFKPTGTGEFQEDLPFRGLDPYRASLLEMGRWSNFELTKLPVDDHSIHLWEARRSEGKELDQRLAVRTLVLGANIRSGTEGLTLPDFAESYRKAVGVLQRQLDRYEPKKRPPMNHLFFNILPVIQADLETARGLIEATVRKQLGERPVSALVRVEILAKVRDKAVKGGYRNVVFMFDQSGPLASGKAFVVLNHDKDSYLVPWNRFQETGGSLDGLAAQDFKPMGVPYRTKTDLDKARAVRQATGNVYVYDRPAVMKNELEEMWRHEGLAPPEDLLQSKELVLQDGRLQEVDRGPMQNDRAMVAWRTRVRLPHEDEPREFIMLSSDYTHKYGSISPKEGEFYDAVVALAEHEGLPFLQILEGTGARIALDPTLSHLLQNHPETGTTYLTQEDYDRALDSKNLEPGSTATKVGDLVEGKWIELPLKEGEPPQQVYLVDTVIGGIGELNSENLSQGSGRMAGRLERAYESIPTMTIVPDTVVGILTYLARIGRRVIQVKVKPQLLTGFRTLNGMYKRTVYSTNRELGDGSVMLPNGVSQYGTNDEPDSFRQFLRWLGFIPRRRGEESPVRPDVRLDDRDVGRILLGGDGEPGVILDAQGKVQGYDPRLLIEALFDQGSFQEAADQWGKIVVAGRARIGGVSTGVITFDPRTQALVIPADPADKEHRERRVQQGGSVWHPDAAYKTAQMLFDFEREGLPKVVLANVKGFPGGSFDMGPGSITKFGAMIVEAMVRAGQGRHLTKGTIVVVPPYGEVRGGAQVVIDAYLNRESVVYLMDEHGQMSVLPRDGMFEVPAVSDYLKAERRYEPKIAKEFWSAVIDAHQTARRAVHVGSVSKLIPTANLRRDIHAALVSKQREVAEREATLTAQAQLRAIATFAGISVTESPDGSLILGGGDVFGAEGELQARFDELLAKAKARRG